MGEKKKKEKEEEKNPKPKPNNNKNQTIKKILKAALSSSGISEKIKMKNPRKNGLVERMPKYRHYTVSRI